MGETALVPRAPHKRVHDPCPWGATTWAACEQAQKEARGRCTAMTEKETECSNWAIEEYEGKGYCGQHYESAVNRALERERAARRRAELDERITAYMEYRKEHPSIWD